MSIKSSTFLEWDSNFFKKRIYKVEILAPLSIDDINNIRKIDADLVYVFVENPSPELITTVEKSGGVLYDKKATYHKQREDRPGIKSADIFIEPEYQLSDKLLEMTLQSGIYSRFRLDPLFKRDFERFYKEWIVNSLNRKIADEVYVAKDASGEKVGFITIAAHHGIGKVGLIAVDANFRGKKIGTLLMQKAEGWYVQKGLTLFEVVTQLDNEPACKLYEKMGYSLGKTEFIFHFTKGK